MVKWKLIILVASRKRVRALETKHARVWLVLFVTECKLIILLHFRENACEPLLLVRLVLFLTECRKTIAAFGRLELEWCERKILLSGWWPEAGVKMILRKNTVELEISAPAERSECKGTASRQAGMVLLAAGWRHLWMCLQDCKEEARVVWNANGALWMHVSVCQLAALLL